MSLREQVTSSARWNSAAAVVTTLVQIAQVLVVPQLLTASEIGLVAIVLIVAGFAQTFADLGVSAAIVQRPHLTRAELSSLYWLNVASGVVAFLIVVVSTPMIAWLYDEPRVLGLGVWAAAPFLPIALGQQFMLLLQRDLRFRALGLIDVMSSVSGVTVVILSALAGFGPLAILWGLLTTAVVRAVGLAATCWGEWRPSLHFRRGDVAPYVGFGLYQMGERMIGYVNARADQFVIGGMLGAEALGFYNLAFQYVMLPVGRVNTTLGAVAFPAFARLQNDHERLRRWYTDLLGIIMLINAPILFGMLAVAPRAIPLIAGPEWAPCIPLLQILALVATIRVTGNIVGSLLLAKGRPDIGFRWNAVILVIQPPIVALAVLLWGLHGAAWSLLALQIVLSPFNYEFNVRRLIGDCLPAYTRSIVAPIAVAAAMAGVVIAVDPYLVGRGLLELVGLCLVGVIVYGVLAPLVLRREFEHVLRGMRPAET